MGGSGDEELKTNEAANLSLCCSTTGSDDKLNPKKTVNLSTGSGGEELKTNEAANLSLGCSNTGPADELNPKKTVNLSTGSGDEELKTNEAANLSLGCSTTGSEDEELRPNEADNLSLGCSTTGSDDEEDCIQFAEQSVNKSIVQVIRMKLAPRNLLKCEEKSVSGQDLQEPSLSDKNPKDGPVEDEEAGYRSLNWSSCGSLNDSLEDEDSVDEGDKSEQVMGNNAVEVVRIVLAKN